LNGNPQEAESIQEFRDLLQAGFNVLCNWAKLIFSALLELFAVTQTRTWAGIATACISIVGSRIIYVQMTAQPCT